MPQYATDHPILSLDPEDLDLIMALVLEGSSLKGLAARYGVSYPTIRTRLDRVIARLNEILEGRQPDPLRELLADLVERGELNGSTARRILGSADARDQSETDTLSGTK
jgi:hypothetical protein